MSNRKLGRYELVEPLGQGGMGEVWLARLSGAGGFEKPAIVKTVLPALAKDPQFVERFHHEGKVLVHLSHSNIAQVYDLDQVDGELFMALEYVAGVDVARLVSQLNTQQELLPVPIAVYIAWQAAEGLAYVHGKAGPDGVAMAIVHRDVSPQNVMVSFEGEVKVIDFGIARSTARSHSTQTATVMGKLGYMAPEQAMAQPVDARADQYALAVLLWELLAGQSYVGAGTTPEVMVAMAQPRLKPLPPLRSEVDAPLEAVVQRALAKEPGGRYATTEDFARALHAELTRLGQPTRKQVGDWVKSRCSDAYAANQRLLSRLATSPDALAQTQISKGVPAMTPSNTDAALAALRPSRTPLIAAVLFAALLLTGVFVFLAGGSPSVPPAPVAEEKPEPVKVPPPLPVAELVEAAATPDAGTKVVVEKDAAIFADGDKLFARAGTEDGLKVGIEVRIVGAQTNDGKRELLGRATVLEVFPKMARLSLDGPALKAPGERFVVLETAAAKPADAKRPAPGVKVGLNAALSLVELPVRAVKLKNNGTFTFNRCTVLVPGQQQIEFKTLGPGMARELVLSEFRQNPSADVLNNEVRLRCAQGSVTIAVQ